MAKQYFALIVVLFAGLASAEEIPNTPISNPLISYEAFQIGVERVGQVREKLRLTELEFLLMAGDPSTVVLDARSAAKFALLHVKGARNLSLPDITEEELAKIIPDKSTRILIYCNNNFRGEPGAFPSKNLGASLNVYTLNVLFAYGYTNVYELGPLIDIHKTIIPFESNGMTAAITR